MEAREAVYNFTQLVIHVVKNLTGKAEASAVMHKQNKQMSKRIFSFTCIKGL